MCVHVRVCSATKQQIKSLIGMSKADLGHVVSQISNLSFPLVPPSQSSSKQDANAPGIEPRM